MQNPWRVPGRSSGSSPPSSVTGDPPPQPDLPPDPPDPTSPLSPQDYPPLTNSPAAPKFKYPTVQRSVRGASYPSQTVAAAKSVDITMTPQEEMVGAATQIETGPISGPETDPQTGSEPTVSFSFPVNTVEAGSCSKSPFTTQRFTTLPPNQPSPILTNKVSSNDQQTTSQNTVPQNPSSETITSNQNPNNSTPPPFAAPNSGRPRVLIPDERKKLEIHNNPINRSTLWSSEHSMSTPTLKAIQIWAHLIGVPLDLRYNKGLSLVAGLVGEPKETDDFTKKSGEPNSFSCKGGSRSYQAVAFGTQTAYALIPASPPHPRPSLKRSRSSPTFSPTSTPNTNPNPFLPLCSDPIKALPFSAMSKTPPPQISLPLSNPPGPILRLNDPDKHQIFISWLLTHKPLFGAILESHVKELSMLPLLTKLCPAWHFTSNHLSDEDGRIILIWKDPLKLHVVHQSWQSLTYLITIPNKEPFYYTAVYASNLVADRSDLWTELIHLHSSLDLENKVWFVGGDFNQIQHHSEHSSPSVSSNDYQMYLLQDCLTQLGLFDLRFTGPSHTWTNNQPDDPIAKMLDRLLVNSTAVAAYPHALSSFLPDISDHTPCLLDLAYHLPTAGT
ncbi:unnamed protein product, partial [Brassica napus]